MSESVEQAAPPREVTMLDRVRVARHASRCIEDGNRAEGDALLDAIRCCEHFPECAHVLDWIGE